MLLGLLPVVLGSRSFSLSVTTMVRDGVRQVGSLR